MYRERTRELVTRAGGAVRGHPALELWHVNNEFGCHVSHCYCDVSAAAFRAWLDGEVRLDRRAQPGVGNGVLVAALRRRSRRSCLRAPPPPSATRPSCSTSIASRAMNCSPATGRRWRSIRARVRCSDHDELHGLLQAGGLLDVGTRGRHRLRRHLPRPGRPSSARVRRHGARSHAIARRRRAMAAHGTGAERGELAGAERGEGAGTDAGVVVSGRRSRRRRRAVLPMAPVSGRVREVPLRTRAARRHRHPRVAGGRAARRRTRIDLRARRRRRRGGDAGAGNRGDHPRLGQLVGDRATRVTDDGRLPRGLSSRGTEHSARSGWRSTSSARRTISPAIASWSRRRTSS